MYIAELIIEGVIKTAFDSYIQLISLFLIIFENTEIIIISDSNDYRKFLLKITYAWHKVQKNKLTGKNTRKITIENDILEITSFSVISHLDANDSCVYFFQDSYLDDTSKLRNFKEIYFNFSKNSSYNTLVGKLNKTNFKQIDKMVGISVPINGIINKNKLQMKKYNYCNNLLLKNLQKV